MKQMTVQHANVGLPMFSTGHTAEDKRRVIVGEDSRVFEHKSAGQDIPFVMRNDVYVIKTNVPKALTTE